MATKIKYAKWSIRVDNKLLWAKTKKELVRVVTKHSNAKSIVIQKIHYT